MIHQLFCKGSIVEIRLLLLAIVDTYASNQQIFNNKG